jgi:hypothetical protein
MMERDKNLNLGSEEMQAGWRVKAVPDRAHLLQVACHLIRFVGMTEDPPADVREYPNEQGRGGLGCQAYLPLTESWLIMSTWPVHGFTRINLSSCLEFDPVAVGNFLAKELGPVLMEWSNQL